MNKSSSPEHGSPISQREALQESERAATETEPANFRDQANAEKIVEIPPVDAESIPIRGLDPK